MAIDRILRLPEVIKLTQLSSSTIYLKISKGEFPKQKKIGARASGWKESEINEWINSL